MNEQPSALRTAANVGAMTVGLGATVAISWLAFGGMASFRGPIRALEDGWQLIYGSEALFAGVVGFVAARPLANAWMWLARRDRRTPQAPMAEARSIRPS